MIDWGKVQTFPLTDEDNRRIERVAVEVTKVLCVNCETATEAMLVLAAVSAGATSMVKTTRNTYELSEAEMILLSKGNA